MDSSLGVSSGMVKKQHLDWRGFIITIDPEVVGLRNKTNSNMRCSKAQVLQICKDRVWWRASRFGFFSALLICGPTQY